MLWHFTAAYFLPGIKASHVQTQSVMKATTSWTTNVLLVDQIYNRGKKNNNKKQITLFHGLLLVYDARHIL
jgi:hypothetical protein